MDARGRADREGALVVRQAVWVITGAAGQPLRLCRPGGIDPKDDVLAPPSAARRWSALFRTALKQTLPRGERKVSKTPSHECDDFVPTLGAPRPAPSAGSRPQAAAISIPIEAEAIDLGSNRGRNEIVDWQPVADSGADLPRGN